MGAVYEVHDNVTNGSRVLKVMLPHAQDNESLRARFAEEARFSGSIESDHVVRTFDAGIDDDTGLPFLVMELLRGEELGKMLVRKHHLAPSDVITYLHQAALALDKTHAAGIVHRDLKPENLFLTRRDDGSPCLKILDFGIAKLVQEGQAAASTMAIGTPMYMAPEQAEGGRAVGPRADIYSLGHVAYALLTGRPYWTEEFNQLGSLIAFFLRLSKGIAEPPSVRAARAGVILPQAFDDWFVQATSTNPEHRFSRSTTAIRALAQAFDIPLPESTMRSGDGLNAAIDASAIGQSDRSTNETLPAPGALETAIAPGTEPTIQAYATPACCPAPEAAAPKTKSALESANADGLGSSTSSLHLQIDCKNVAWSRREYTRKQAFRWMNRLAALGMVGVLGSLFFGAMSITVPFEKLQELSTSRLLLTSLLLCGGSFGGAIIAGLFAAFGGRTPYAFGAGKVEIQSDHVVISGAETHKIAKTDVTQGWLEDVTNSAKTANQAAQWQVVLGLRNGHQIALHVPSKAEGEELLRALGVSVTDRVLRVHLRSAASLVKNGELFGVTGLLIMLGILPLAVGQSIVSAISLYFASQICNIADSVLLGHAGWMVIAAAIAGTAFYGARGVSRFLQRREVVVGADGIAVEGFGKRIFVAHDQVATVRRDPHGVKLELRNGKSLLLPTLCESLVPLPTVAGARLKLGAMATEIPDLFPSGVSREELYKRDVARRETLIDRIELARSAAADTTSVSPRLDELLDQRDESLDVWKTRLQQLLESNDPTSPYRIAQLTSTELANVVEDATALPERRIAAAIALSSSADAHVRKRLRVAVETCADENTRAALEAAAEGELQELALQRLRQRL